MAKLLAAAFLHQRPPSVEQNIGGRRRSVTGQALADKQTDRFGEEGLVAGLGPAEALQPAGVFKQGIEIGGDAGHPPAADGLHPHLFDRVENGAGGLRARTELFMKPGVMVAQGQRCIVGQPADAGDVGPADPRRRRRAA